MPNKVPITSLEAFLSQSPEKLQKDYGKIIKALEVLKIANYDQIAKHINIEDRNVVSRRMKELELKGFVYKPGSKSLTSRNRAAFDYCLSTNGEVSKEPERLMEGKGVADFASDILKNTSQGNLFTK